jgi:hypothetical protein
MKIRNQPCPWLVYENEEKTINCERCGATEQLPIPSEVYMKVALMRCFLEKHAHCAASHSVAVEDWQSNYAGKFHCDVRSTE